MAGSKRPTEITCPLRENQKQYQFVLLFKPMSHCLQTSGLHKPPCCWQCATWLPDHTTAGCVLNYFDGPKTRGQHLWLEIHPSHTACCHGVLYRGRDSHTHWPARLCGSVDWAAGRRAGCWAASSPDTRRGFGCQPAATVACLGPTSKRTYICFFKELQLAFHLTCL